MPGPNIPVDLKTKRVTLLAWEAACERLRNALNPQGKGPPASREDLAESIAVARKALDNIEQFHLHADDGTKGS